MKPGLSTVSKPNRPSGRQFNPILCQATSLGFSGAAGEGRQRQAVAGHLASISRDYLIRSDALMPHGRSGRSQEGNLGRLREAAFNLAAASAIPDPAKWKGASEPLPLLPENPKPLPPT